MASENLTGLMDIDRQETDHVHVTHVQERTQESNIGTTSSIAPAPPLPRRTIGENYLDNKKILLSEVRYDSVEWTTSMSANENLFQKFLPDIFAQVASFHRTVLKTYVFYRPTLTLRLQVNATPQHMGLLRLYWDPMVQYADSTSTPSVYNVNGIHAPTKTGFLKPKDPNIFSTSGQPHVEVQASNSSPVELTIPFEHILDALTTNSKDLVDFMGRLSLQIISPLQAPPTSSSEVTVQLWGSLNCDLHVPIWEHTPEIPVLRLEAHGSEDGSWWSSALSLGKGIAGTVYNAATGNYNGAIKSGVSTACEAVGLFMDKPNDPNRAVPNMVHPFPPLAHTQGVGGAVRLDAAPEGGYTETDFSVTPAQEMLLSHICKQPMMIFRNTWSSSQAPGTLLRRFPVTPMLANYDKLSQYGAMTTNGNTYPTQFLPTKMDHTHLSYVSKHFAYWSGSITFKFKFVTTQFHTGRISVTFVPNNSTVPAGLTMSELTSANTKTFDVAGDKEFTFTAPFMSPVARKSVYPWAIVNNIDDRHTSGWIEIRVIGKLTTTNAVPDTVPFFTWISAGEDFFLEGLRVPPFYTPDGDPLIVGYQKPNPIPLKIEAHADDGDDLVNETKTIAPRQMTNTRVRSVQDIGRRLCPLHTTFVKMDPRETRFYDNSHLTIATIGGQGIYTIDVNPYNMCDADPRSLDGRYETRFSSGQDLPGSICRMFAFWSGSIDYLFIPQVPSGVNVILRAFFWPGAVDDIAESANSGWYALLIDQGIFGSLPTHETVVEQQHAIAVSVPWYSNYNQRIVQSSRVPSGEETNNGKLVVQIQCDSIDKLPKYTVNGVDQACIPLQVKRAFGDDFRLSYLVAPPRELVFSELNYPVPPP